jgi:hypothetical protein
VQGDSSVKKSSSFVGSVLQNSLNSRGEDAKTLSRSILGQSHELTALIEQFSSFSDVDSTYLNSYKSSLLMDEGENEPTTSLFTDGNEQALSNTFNSDSQNTQTKADSQLYEINVDDWLI